MDIDMTNKILFFEHPVYFSAFQHNEATDYSSKCYSAHDMMPLSEQLTLSIMS